MPRAWRFIFWLLGARQWRLKAALARTLPEPVTEKRFLAELLLFNFDIVAIR